jgi:hypothetical protein
LSLVADDLLIVRMAKASMGAALILSDLLPLGPHPILETCSKLRGLHPKCFIHWAGEISKANDDEYIKLAGKTFKSFKKRVRADSSCLEELDVLCQKVELFLNKYRKKD